MAKQKTEFRCSECGWTSVKWAGPVGLASTALTGDVFPVLFIVAQGVYIARHLKDETAGKS